MKKFIIYCLFVLIIALAMFTCWMMGASFERSIVMYESGLGRGESSTSATPSRTANDNNLSRNTRSNSSSSSGSNIKQDAQSEYTPVIQSVSSTEMYTCKDGTSMTKWIYNQPIQN